MPMEVPTLTLAATTVPETVSAEPPLSPTSRFQLAVFVQRTHSTLTARATAKQGAVDTESALEGFALVSRVTLEAGVNGRSALLIAMTTDTAATEPVFARRDIQGSTATCSQIKQCRTNASSTALPTA